MKQDEVLQTLREVIAEAENFTTWTVSTPHLVELVKRLVELARADEREACARVCEGINSTEDYYGERLELFFAEAIRARGNT